MLFDFTCATKSTELAPLKLINANTSAGGVVQSFDMKHNDKRSRTRDLSKKGVTISEEGLPLNRDSYPELFRWYDGKPEETYSSLFNVDDKYVLRSVVLVYVTVQSACLRSCVRMRRVRSAVVDASRTKTTE